MKKLIQKKAVFCIVVLLCLCSVSDMGFCYISADGAQEKSVNLASLNTEIALAKGSNTGNSTAESAALLQAAISFAEETASKDSISQTEINTTAEMLKKVKSALVEKESDASVLDRAKSGKYDGLYTVEGKLWHAATKNQASMGNDALKKPIEVRVQKGVPSLRIEFIPLTSKLGTMQFTGYLGHLWYFPGYYGTAIPTNKTPVLCPVEEYYDIVDAYNHAATGTDPKMKGKKYPHYVSMPVTFRCDSYFVQVYVSVMEAISAGSGTQYAKLAINWNSMKQTEGASTDKTKLRSAINLLASFQTALTARKVNQQYTQKQKSMLNAACTAGNALEADMNASQTEINTMAEALTAVKEILGITETANKDKLSTALTAAASALKQTSVYTAASLKNLKTVYDAAQKIFTDYLASQSEVDAQTQLVSNAISSLKKQNVAATTTKKNNTKSTGKKSTTAKKKSTKKSTTAKKKSTKKSTTAKKKSTKKSTTAKKKSTKKTTESKKVSINNLEDGIYTITGDMVKIDKNTLSMSNDAINHTMKLTVKKGVYYLTMDFNGLDINGMTGYLGTLKYFKSGYKLDANGSPVGSLGNVTVDSYQKDSKGNRYKDALGTDYPDKVTFPLIKEAIKDGYVPLQVFVPVMESISAGTGTQPVFLKLDLNNVRTGYTKSADSGSTVKSGTSSSSHSSQAGNSSSGAGSTLTNNTLGNSLQDNSSSGNGNTGNGTLGSSTLGNSTPGDNSPVGSGPNPADAAGSDDGQPADTSGDGTDPKDGLSVGTLNAAGNVSDAGDLYGDETVNGSDMPLEQSSMGAAVQDPAQQPPLQRYVKPTGLGMLLLALVEAVSKARKMGMLRIEDWIQFIK